MTRICIIDLIGLPAVGKTTFCEQLLKISAPFNIIHVCYDHFVKFDFEASFSYKSQRKDMLKRIKELMETIHGNKSILDLFTTSNFSEGCNKFVILIDDNNFYQSMRYEFYRIAKEFQASFGQIFFSFPLHTALLHNSQRNISIPEEVIARINARLEVPSPKNKWENNTFVVRSEDINYNQVINFLDRSFESVIKESPSGANNSCEQSHIHKIDLLLRKRVGTIIKNYAKSEEKADVISLAKYLNDKRKQILSDIKDGVIDVQVEDYSHLIKLI